MLPDISFLAHRRRPENGPRNWTTCFRAVIIVPFDKTDATLEIRLQMRNFVLLLLAAGFVMPAHAVEPVPVATPAPEWDAVFDRADGWIGGDAIYSTPLAGGDILWLFADTYIGQVRDRRRQMGVKMVNNTLARHPRPAAGEPPQSRSIEFLWGADDDQPAAWIRPDPTLRPAGADASKQWYWVADAIVAPGPTGDDRLLVFLWRIASTGAKVFSFRNAGTALAVIENPRAEWRLWQPKQFDVAHSRVAADGPQASVDVVWGSEIVLDNAATGEPRLLIYGYRQRKGKVNELILAQAPAAEIENMERWRFRTDDGWSDDVNGAAPLAGGITTEFSVSRMDSSSDAEWIMVHSEPFLGENILIRRLEHTAGALVAAGGGLQSSQARQVEAPLHLRSQGPSRVEQTRRVVDQLRR